MIEKKKHSGIFPKAWICGGPVTEYTIANLKQEYLKSKQQLWTSQYVKY